MVYLIVSLILLLASIVIAILVINKNVVNKISENNQKYKNEIKQLESEKEKSQMELAYTNQQLEQTKQHYDLLAKTSIQAVKDQVQRYTQLAKIEQDSKLKEEFQKLKDKLEKEYDEQYARYDYELDEYLDTIKELEDDYDNQLMILQDYVEDFRRKREAINEAVRREAELENEENLHRIIISDFDKQDIEYLLSIESKIHNKELLHKLIWSEYIQRPFNSMIKAIFGNKIPKNVIYCIENRKTKQKYIGKTKGVCSDRWKEHVKSSLGIGTISHQAIHDALLGSWDDFIFNVIEVVNENQNLGERETYYIKLFESNIYGYNIKGGS